MFTTGSVLVRATVRSRYRILFGGVCVRAGELLKAIARRLFHLPVCRFVDDFFAAEHEEVADHGMKIFAK